MENKIADYQGKKLWNLTVIGLDPEYIGKTYNANKWLFQCDCGNVFSASPSRVLSGHKKSCGCRKKINTKRHGVCASPFYHTWWSMMQRCYNPEHHNYSRYGARGITVCEEWHDPVAFVEWASNTIGEKDPGLTLDRVDNSKGYSPSNCRWATRSEQSNNRRNTLIVEYNGEKIPIADLARQHNVDLEMLRARIFLLGWEVEDALSIPKKRRARKPTKKKGSKKGILIDGEIKTVSEWCEIFGTSRDLAFQRISRGWEPEAAIKTPKKTEWDNGKGHKIIRR